MCQPPRVCLGYVTHLWRPFEVIIKLYGVPNRFTQAAARDGGWFVTAGRHVCLLSE